MKACEGEVILLGALEILQELFCLWATKLDIWKCIQLEWKMRGIEVVAFFVWDLSEFILDDALL